MKSNRPGGTPLWGYRYRTGGRGSERVQHGGFGSEQDARESLERALERVRRANGTGTTLTLAGLVDEYLAQHDAQPETIEKLRWLLSKAVSEFGSQRLGQLRSQEIAAWRMTIPAGHRFEATQAIYGVGPILACHLLAELGEAARFRRARQAVRAAGLDPVVDESGETRRRGRLAKHGSPVLRWALVEAAQHDAGAGRARRSHAWVT
jgi:transposase